MAKSKIRNTGNLEQYASKGTLVFSGSLLVLSVSLNNAGLGKIVDAYSQSIVHNIESKQSCDSSLEDRLVLVESLAHKSSKQDADKIK